MTQHNQLDLPLPLGEGRGEGITNDPARMGVGRLRGWNDDAITPCTGFNPHPHRDMEIITYIRARVITHKDSLGNVGRTEAGDVQVMHAGTGIVYAGYNHEDVATRLFQIWILPDQRGVAPGWGTRPFPPYARWAGLILECSSQAMHMVYPAQKENMESADYIKGPKAFAEKQKPVGGNR